MRLIDFKGILLNSPCLFCPSTRCALLCFSCHAFCIQPAIRHMARPHKTSPAIQSLSKSLKPPHKGKKSRQEKHPKLHLHNVLLYNSSFFSGVAKPRILPAGYISTLCKVAARPTLAQGAVHLAPSTLVGQWFLAPKPLRQKPLLGLPSGPQSQPNGRSWFYAPPSGQARAEPPAGRCFASCLLEGSSIPQTPWIIFLNGASPANQPTAKAHSIQKNVYLFTFN
jgi:hypothetical protein